MANKNNENRVIYAALTLVLTILSILVIVTGVATRRAEESSDPSETEKDKIIEKVPEIKKPETEKKPLDTVKRNDKDGKKEEDTKNPDENITLPIIEDHGAAVEESEEMIDVSAEPEMPEFIAPANGTLSKSHSETVLVYSMTMEDYRTHSGIDIAVAAGDTVVAAADGIVGEVFEDPMWGYCVSIIHEGDAVSYYKNLSREVMTNLTSGDEVSRGDVIGSVGDTALYEIADEPHLHFELKIGGVSVDPTDYFEINGVEVYEG